MIQSYSCTCSKASSFSLNQKLPDIILPVSTACVWLAEIAQLTPHIQKISGVLSRQEVDKAYQFRNESQRLVYLISHGLLRYVLSYYTGEAPGNLSFHTSAVGKPYLLTYPVFFNLSHAKRTVAVAVNRADEIGIDVEEAISGFAWREVAEQYFSQEEIACLRGAKAEEAEKGFYIYWTRKEAFLKSIGTGIADNIHQIKMSGKLNQFRHQSYQPALTSNLHWNILTFDFGKTCTGSVAYSSKVTEIQFVNAALLL